MPPDISDKGANKPPLTPTPKASDIATDAASLCVYVKTFLGLGQFEDAAAVITVLATVERGSQQGPPHLRRLAGLWTELANAAAQGKHAPLSHYLREAEQRFGPHAYTVPKVVELAVDPAGARAALQRLVDADPADLAAREGLVRALVRCDCVADAEQHIATCLVGASDPGTLDALRALVAMRKQDWDAARVAWAGYARHRPGDYTAANAIDRVNLVQHLAEAERTQGAPRPAPLAPGYCDEPVTRQLLLRFESIGTDCDFGTVQRRFGAEPLGLFRWASTGIPQLLNVANGRFAGIGEPENTALLVGPEGHILLEDRRWGLTTHTFLFEQEVSLDALHPKMCRRMAYLRDKFVADLREGAKTLVFNSDLADRRELILLHEALRGFGPVRLLNARTTAASRDFTKARAGSVCELRPGLFVGRLSRVKEGDPPFREWIELCQGVERMVDEAVEPMPAFGAA